MIRTAGNAGDQGATPIEPPSVPATDDPLLPEAAPGDGRVRLLGVLLAVSLCAVIALLIWRSRGWPLIQDPPVLHYVAWRMDLGEVPYRDHYDMNFPGAYALHLLVLELFGPSDAAWRVFDLAWLVLTALTCAIYCRRFGVLASISAALFVALFHVDGGVLRAGQRDYILVVFLVAAAHLVARFCEGRGGPASLIFAGLVVGSGMTIKPFAAIFWLFLAVYSAVQARRLGRRWWSASAAVLGGGMIPVAAAIAWLWWIGGLGAFYDITFRYLLPLYGRVGRVPPTILLRLVFEDRFFVAMLAIAAVPFCRGALGGLGRGGLGPARTLLLAGLIYGVMHFGLQGKGWGYHQYPQIAFACLMVAAAGWRGGLSAGGPAPVQWATLVALALAAGIGTYSLVTYRDNIPRKKIAYMQTLVAEVADRTGPDDTVQVLDTTGGGLDMLMRLKLHQPTVFIYDFHFYHHVQHPYIQDLKERFLCELKACPPKAVVLFKNVWPNRGDEHKRLQKFPELLDWLTKNYRVALDHDEYNYTSDRISNYRIYVQRENSRGRPVVRQ